MTGKDEYHIKVELGRKDIGFVQGTISALPFADNEFECVFSNSVIEQFPRQYMKVFKEAKRVCSNVAFFSEPFREAEPDPIRRLYLRNIDYFNASYSEVTRAGFDIVNFDVPALQKFSFNDGLLTCRVRKP